MNLSYASPARARGGHMVHAKCRMKGISRPPEYTARLTALGYSCTVPRIHGVLCTNLIFETARGFSPRPWVNMLH